MKPVSLLLAGSANPHARRYFDRFVHESTVKLLAFADDDAKRLADAGSFFRENGLNVKLYSSWREMFETHSEAEAVMIGTDNSRHFDIAKEAIIGGLHVYSMKIISMDEAECEELIKLKDEKGTLFQVEFELHFAHQYKMVRNRVQQGLLGDIESIYLTNVSQSADCWYPNWGDPELTYGKRIPLRPGSKVCRGGALTDHPHPFDLIRWITGQRFKRIFAISGRNQRNYLQYEDHMAITGELEGGAKFFVNPSYSNLEERVPARRLYWPKSLEVNLKITGSKAYMAADFFDKHIYVMGSGYESPNRLMVDYAGRYGLGGQWALIDSFAEAVRGRRTVESTAEDGLYAVRVMNAIYDSVSTGEPVELL